MPRLKDPQIIIPNEQPANGPGIFISKWNLKTTTTDVNKALLLHFKSDVKRVNNIIAKHELPLQVNDPCKIQGYTRTDCGAQPA